MSTRFGFSKAAATRSLSFSCLLTAASVEWVPGVTKISTCVRTQHLQAALNVNRQQPQQSPAFPITECYAEQVEDRWLAWSMDEQHVSGIL